MSQQVEDPSVCLAASMHDTCTPPGPHMTASPIGQWSPVCPVPAVCLALHPGRLPLPAGSPCVANQPASPQSLCASRPTLGGLSALFRILSTAMQTLLLPRSCNHGMGHVVNGVC
ncbi:hypothetical protein BU16DRAFT_530214 [Lophium mytilinum]|uniref:Uncharacterized protein n=1 Tax=Lophium mytilinum TaxID=390894 RepID=A0A6A6QJD2_9PEZI|nr:hypothetical protein BU16DRAFT_530214 [Lophium mytilinum]